jgi:DNA-binding SARP family transcriptional activator
MLLAEIPRAKELAATTELAVPLASLADALVADATGELDVAESVIASIDRERVPAGWRAPLEFMAMWCAYGRGDAAAVRGFAADFVAAAPESFPGRPFVGPWVDWVGGTVPKDLVDLPRPGHQAGSTDADRLWSGASFGIMWANAGLGELAREAVALSVSAARSAFLPQHRATAVAASAALAVADGDDELAGQILSDFLDEPGVDIALVERSLRSVMVIAVALEPRLREWWRAHPPGPLFDASVALGEAAAGARAGGAAGLPDSALSHLGTSVPLRWAVQMVCCWQRHDQRRARRALEQLAADHGERVRRELRVAVEAGGADSVAARKLLSTVGFRSAPVELCVLGPTRLHIGGRPCDGDDWRRERVRELASLLAHRRRIRRDVAAALLWPDLDPDAARRNLRVTLNYLQRLIEPDRLANEAPFYLHQHDDWLELLEAPHVVVDAERLDHALVEADRSRDQGALRSALETYRSALADLAGPLLEEFADREWASLDAARGRTRLVAAHLTWSSLELAFGQPDRAMDAALAAVAFDPYSEAARRTVVDAQLAAGDHGAARRSLAACLEMLAELGVGPSELTRVLVRRLND